MSEPDPMYVIMPRIKRDVGTVGKSSRNAAQGFDFRGVDDVVNAVAAVLIEHGVTVYPVRTVITSRDVETSNGKAARESVVTVQYRFVGPAGDALDAEVSGEAMDSGDKATAKAMSVAYRIALLQTLSLPTGERDPDADSYQRQQPQSAPYTATAVRNEIADIAQRKGISFDTVAEDFRSVMNGGEIATASVPVLAEYRDRIAEYDTVSS